MTKLPVTNELGFFEIRLESIGGLGANLAGKMLAEAGVVGSGYNGVSFSSYGSEKKGSPVKAHIRFCELDVNIRDTTPVERPHIVAVFHENLAKTVNVVSGAYPDSIVLVNSAQAAAQLKENLKLAAGRMAVVDATGIALEERNKVNMAMLGALFRLCSFLDADHMRGIIRKSLEKKYPQAVEAALRTFNRGYDEVTTTVFSLAAGEAMPEPVRWDIPVLGYNTLPLGGMITNPGNSLFKDLSISRQGMLPHFDASACIHCAACDTACPDLCFVWKEQPDKKGRPQMFLQGIDYQYCKGCLKCVTACPTDALSSRREVGDYALANRTLQRFRYA
ncbi:ferredoxin [Paenibacillus sambharensis]|uniref:Ferredoxin n=1 Tax=Paenibacillus sambharensis TaxID=1803190 RepID=A0A2W1L6F6_9BACL|nr:2-oxoacid:acceptor oxidoreductase family protein [Paenibacillus sambharensis]PZD93700.1 ferredoxin [Paenibacillus sambharensis]